MCNKHYPVCHQLRVGRIALPPVGTATRGYWPWPPSHRIDRVSGNRDRGNAEPDITVLVVMIAAASLLTIVELALVVSLPAIWVWFAGLLPVVFWALLLREIARLLNSSTQHDDDSER
jgi:hypothetical protein